MASSTEPGRWRQRVAGGGPQPPCPPASAPRCWASARAAVSGTGGSLSVTNSLLSKNLDQGGSNGDASGSTATFVIVVTTLGGAIGSGPCFSTAPPTAAIADTPLSCHPGRGQPGQRRRDRAGDQQDRWWQSGAPRPRRVVLHVVWVCLLQWRRLRL